MEQANQDTQAVEEKEMQQEVYMAQNFGILVNPADPIVQNAHLQSFLEKTTDYQEVQDDGSVMFPVNHTDLAYLLHLIYCTSEGKGIILEMYSLLQTVDNDQQFNIQIARLYTKE